MNLRGKSLKTKLLAFVSEETADDIVKHAPIIRKILKECETPPKKPGPPPMPIKPQVIEERFSLKIKRGK